VDELCQTMVTVTHDPRAAAMADRILFIADGLIVKDICESTAVEVLAAMQEVTGRRSGSRSRASRLDVSRRSSTSNGTLVDKDGGARRPPPSG
jgi:ABC-type proline/glycine betaine transport system ATPase subunit